MNLNANQLRLLDARSYQSGFLAATLGAFTFAAANCNGLTAPQTTTESVWPTAGWQSSTPEQQGMDSKQLAKAVEWGILSFDSFLVVRHGKIVAEAYYAPYSAGIPHQMNSVTKAVTSTLIGIACQERLLDTPNHRVLDFFDRHEIANLDDKKEAITIQNLLDMTSGIAWTELGMEGMPSSSAAELTRSPNWISFILNQPMWYAPGVDFNYNSGNQHLLSAILTELSGMSAIEYAKAKLFGPLGINDLYWRKDPQGISSGGFGLFLQPRDMAKIGYLYLHNGVWEGKQLLPPAWIDKVNNAKIDMHLGQGLRYSNCFWALPEKHVYIADGYRGQIIMVFPELDLIAVTTGRANFSLNEFADLISSSVRSNKSLYPDPESAELLSKKILDVSTEKPTDVGPSSKTAEIISGKVYRFPRNEINIKSLSLVLTGPQPHYEVKAYGPETTKADSLFAGPIGLDGLYRKGELTLQGLASRLEGVPRINAVKGSWLDDHTLVIDRFLLGMGQPPERWTLAFDGDSVELRLKFGDSPEVGVKGEASQETTESFWPTKGWQTSSPEEQGMDSEALAGLVDFGSSHSFDSILITRHGKIVTEAYYAPYTAAIPHAVNSITKAVISTLTAIAWKEGALDTPAHRVLDFFDPHNIANLDDRKAAVTVQNLLDMTSGFDWTEGLSSFISPLAMEQSANWVKFVLDRPMPNAPGEVFNYNSGNPQVLSAILTKLTGTTAMNYAKNKLFGPLGIEPVCWRQDPQGNSCGGYGLYLQLRDMAKIGYLYLRDGVWEGKQLIPPAWIDKIKHATVDMHSRFEPGLRYANFFWALPDKHVYMAVGHHRQIIMIFPDLDMVAVTTGRGDYSFSEFASLVASTVKSDTELASNPAGAELLANRLLEVSTEKPSKVGPASKLSATISGKVYRFPPNDLGVKSLSLVLTDGQPHYDLETYASDSTESGLRFTDPIGLDGRYRKGELIYHGFSDRLEGTPRVNAIKGTWQGENTFLLERLGLGQGEPPEQWTLVFFGGKLNLLAKFPESGEIYIEGQAGG